MLYDSVNFCINWVNDNGNGNGNGEFEDRYGYGYDVRKGSSKEENRELVNGRF